MSKVVGRVRESPTQITGLQPKWPLQVADAFNTNGWAALGPAHTDNLAARLDGERCCTRERAHRHLFCCRNFLKVRLRLKCDGTRAEARFRLSAKRTSPFKSAGASVQSTTGSRVVRISGSNAGYTMFRGSVKGTGYPLHSPFSPSLSLPCVTVCHHISTGLYNLTHSRGNGTVAGDNRMQMFQHVRAHWQTTCFCTDVYCVIRLCLSSKT